MGRIIHTPNGIYEIDEEDCYIRNHMSSGHVFESHIINGTLKPYIEKSKYIIDAGANIGCHGISYAHFNPDATVWSFEPQKNLYEILSRNVARNGLGSRVHVFNKGLGHKTMSVSLASLDTVRDDAPHQQGWNKGGIGIGEGGEMMDVVTVDSLNLPGLDFMKIDVEGAEGLVIKGAANTIKKYKPVIFFEHNEQRIDPKLVGLDGVPTPFVELVKLGYKHFEYTDWDNYIAK